MKTKILHIAGAIACATLTAMALAGCANDKFEPNPAENGKLTTVSLTAGIERAPLTRTDITDPANPIWTAGDAIGFA